MKWLYRKYIAIFVDSLVEEIKSTGIIKSTLKSTKILDSGWGRIPNIKNLRIKLGEYNKILQLTGMEVREGNVLRFEPLKADRMNRFMTFQLMKLSSYRSTSPSKYFKLAFALMRRSSSFRVSAINHVFRGWYKVYPLWWILRVNRKASKILRDESTLLDFSRVYIPKAGSDKVRPLGVPTPEWRLVLHMANNFFHWYLKDSILPTQHGFMPGRGSLTAWKSIFERGLLDKPFVYECDLKQFFPSVNLDVLNSRLLKLKVPIWVVNWIDAVNSRLPKLPSKVEVPEDKAREEESWMGALSRALKRADPRPSFGNERFKQGIAIDLKTRVLLQDGSHKYIEWEEMESLLPPRGRFDRRKYRILPPEDPAIPGAKDRQSRVGVPQGAPTSPFLSILILNKFLSQQESISYADDPVFFGDTSFKIYDSPHEGITIHPEKSGWVKREGQWLRPLKFLGLEYDGRVLRAKTRNGSTLELGQDKKSCLQAISQLEHEMYRDQSETSGFQTSKDRVLDNWYNLFKSRLIGHLVSRMYCGSWNLQDYWQDFELKMVSTSWLDLKWKDLKSYKKYTIFNASSYASWSLAEILTRRYRKPRRKPLVRRVASGGDNIERQVRTPSGV